MRKTIRAIISVILWCGVTVAGAQEVTRKDSVSGFNAMDYLIQDRYRYPDKAFMNKHWMDNLYLRIGGGLFAPNRTGENPMKWMQDYHVSIGKNLTPKHGFRLGFNFGKGGLKAENLAVSQYSLQLDHLFNVSAYIMGYNPDRLFEISTVLGAGYRATRIAGETHRAPEGHLGLELRYKVGPQSYFTLEPQVQLTDGYRQDDWRHMGLSSGATLSYIQYLRPLTTAPTNSSRYTGMSPFFVEWATGLQFQHLDQGLWDSRGGSYAAYVGKWLSRVFGVRTGVNASFNRIQSETLEGVSQHADATYTDARFDMLFNPLALFTKNGSKSWGGMHLLGGILYGYAHPFDGRSGYSYSGYNAGIQGWLRLQDNMQLFLEPRVSFIGSEDEYETLYNLNLGVRMNYSTWDERRLRYLRNDLFRPSFFVQAAGGVSYIALHQHPYTRQSSLDYAGRISAGYRFTPYHALRANVGYSQVPGVSVDYLFGLSNLMQEGYDKDRSLSFDVYAGPVWSWESNLWGGHAGVQVKKKLNAHTSLFVMPEVTFLPKDESEAMLQHDWNPMFHVYAGVEYGFKGTKDFFNGLFPQARNKRAGSDFPFFIETGAGIGALLDAPVRWSDTAGPSFRYAIGHWINPAVAARLSAEASWRPLGDELHGQLYLGGADVLFNPFGMSSQARYDKRLGLNLVAGGNWGVQKEGHGELETVYGFGGGVQLWTRLMPHTRFFIEPRYSRLWTDRSSHSGQGYLNAQVGVVMDYVAPKRRTSSTTAGQEFPEKGLFFQWGGGVLTNSMTLGASGNAKDLNSTWGLGAGYRFTPLSALRMRLDAQKFNAGENREERLAASLAYMLNLNTLLSGYQPDQRFSTQIYAGPSGYYNHTRKSWLMGGLVGMQLGYRVNSRMALHLSPEWQLAFRSGHSDKRLAYQLGMTYSLNGRNQHLQQLDWFFDVSTGAQQLSNAPLPAQHTWGQAQKIAMGTWMNSLVGIRFAGTASSNRWMHKNEKASKYLQQYSFQPSLLFDPLSLIPSYARSDAKAGLYLLAGPEVGMTVQDKDYRWVNQYATGWHAGLQGWVRVGSHQRLFIEPVYRSMSIESMGVQLGLSLDMVKNKTPWRATDDWNRFYVQLGAGHVSDIYNQNRYTKSTLRPSVEFAAGYRIDPLSSIRFSLGYQPGKQNVSLQDSDLSAAYQLNLSNLFLGENKNRRLELEAFAGLSCIKVHDLVLSVGSIVGVQANYHLRDNLYLYVAPEARMVHSKYKTLFGVGYRF